MKITERQKQILDFIAESQAKNGFPPTIREICSGLGLVSPGSLIKHLQVLERDGYLNKSAGKKRSWRLVHKPSKLNKSAGKKRSWRLAQKSSKQVIPVLGKIAAGTPILAQQNKDDELPVDPKLFGSDQVFALRITGDSMIEEQIRDGDLAIIRPQNDAETGEIVAVQVEDLETEATLKVLRKRNGDIELHPANALYPVLAFRAEEKSRVRILGKLVGIIRADKVRAF